MEKNIYAKMFAQDYDTLLKFKKESSFLKIIIRNFVLKVTNITEN
jgi:hypothetical protein